MLRIGRPRRGVRRLESPEADAARTFGRQLCESVFSGDVGVAWQRSMDDAEREGLGLRLRLRLGDASELAELPWEYLYLPTADRHLVLSAWTPLVRYLDLPRAPKPLTVQPPLRLLAMVSSPSDYPALDTDTEWSKVSASLDPLEDAGMVEVTRLDTATLHELQRALRRTDYHVFHFIGHGGFDEQASDGILVLEDENNRSRRVTGHELGTILTDARSIRLAVLNSCEGARAGGADPFGGTAPTLVRGGIPAVVAMQFEITDAAAIVFAQELYAAVADGYPIDAAVAEARRAIFGAGNDVEWGTPVLYMRADDGRLFDVESDKRPSVVSTPDPQAEEHALEEAPEDVIAPLDSGSVEMDTEEIERIADVTDTVSDQPASLPEIEPLTEHPGQIMPERRRKSASLQLLLWSRSQNQTLKCLCHQIRPRLPSRRSQASPKRLPRNRLRRQRKPPPKQPRLNQSNPPSNRSTSLRPPTMGSRNPNQTMPPMSRRVLRSMAACRGLYTWGRRSF